MSWQQRRQELQESIRRFADHEPAPETKPADAERGDEFFNTFDEESLRRIEQGFTDGGLKFSRHGSSVELGIPLSARDAKEAVEWLKTARHLCDSNGEKPLEVKIFALIDARLKGQDTVVLTADAVKTYEELDRIGLGMVADEAAKALAAASPQTREAANAPEAHAKEANASSTAFDLPAAIGRRGVPIRGDLSIDGIIGQFNQNVLAPSGPAPLIAPGDGLVNCSPLPLDVDLCKSRKARRPKRKWIDCWGQ